MRAKLGKFGDIFYATRCPYENDIDLISRIQIGFQAIGKCYHSQARQ